MAANPTDILRQGTQLRVVPPPATLDEELARPPRELWEIPFAAEDLYELRQLIAGWAAREAMSQEAADDLVLSVHEIATNSIRHGGGVGMMRLWRTADTLVCEVQDSGRIANPTIGQVEPGTSPAEGRGLYIANQLCDEVQIRTGSAGTQVRMHKRLV
jgi:anti-sigma regulatory factor (Ser/Thr protein kinase)